VAQPTLADIAHLLAQPTGEMVERAASSAGELVRSVDAARFALGRLLERDLRGMFDGPSSRSTDWTGRGLVLDLSAVHADADALALVMIAATAWLQALLAPSGRAPDEGPRRIQVIDAAWALLGNERTARYREEDVGIHGQSLTRPAHLQRLVGPNRVGRSARDTGPPVDGCASSAGAPRARRAGPGRPSRRTIRSDGAYG
jgi:hypothetical protein